jgi:hypothetical protein
VNIYVTGGRIVNILVKMTWNETHQKYLMTLPDGKFIYDFWDCGNIARIFDGKLDKSEGKWFEVQVKQRTEVN